MCIYPSIYIYIYIYVYMYMYVCMYVWLDSIWSNVAFKASVLFCFLLFIYCLRDLSIDLSGMLKFPAIIVLLSVFLFMSVNICFIYIGTPILGACVTSVSWIGPLIINVYPSAESDLLVCRLHL